MPACFVFKIAIVLFFLSTLVSSAEHCIFQDTCERCLSASMDCAWCTDKRYEGRYRCLERSFLLTYGCDADQIYENEPKFQTLQNKSLTDYNENDGRASQIQPQRAFVKLIKSHSQRMKLSYRPARDNLLDLYVLMDLTWTMRDDKDTLVKLGTELAETLGKLTKNYHLGFGSFADKPVFPMIMPQIKDNPCALEHAVCEPTYGYKHHLSLTQNVSNFISSVNASRITGNLDNLEGGMDALMQVLVCPDIIGWRKEARKIVLLATDGLMHYAGDGLLAGITQRNDKQCHLSKDGDYLGSLIYDYPSLEEIYRELVKRKINVIFAVTADIISKYRQVSSLMQELTNTELLRADSSNLLELISKSYLSFTKRVQFTDNSPSYIKIDYETNCGDPNGELKKVNYCNNIEPGSQVDFYLTITLTDFPPDDVYTHIINIEEASIAENLQIEVEIQKPCPCNETPNPNDEFARDQCGDNGFLHCGMCQCDEGWAGRFCNCPINETNLTTTEMVENMCRPPTKSNKQLGAICSNQGECDCGNCYCFEGYSGKYCECPDCDADCDPERAECICGQCVCKYGWSGSQCNCAGLTENCIGPTGELCSDRGYCKCGVCECEDPYLGQYCEIGSELDNKLCSYFEPCVSCLIEEKLGNEVCSNFTEECSHKFTYVYDENDLEGDTICLVRLINQYGISCDHYFKYLEIAHSVNQLVIHVNNCEPVNYVALVSFVSLATFLLGLLITVCIMWCLRRQDAQEYARFLQQQRNSYKVDNPIYKNPISIYKVPKEINTNDPFR